MTSMYPLDLYDKLYLKGLTQEKQYSFIGIQQPTKTYAEFA